MTPAVGLAFVAKLSTGGRQLLERQLVRHAFTRGRTIIEKGQPVSGAYFVVSGRLRVSTVTPDGKEATLYNLDPGDTCILALNSLFNDLLYPAWVHTEVDTVVAVVPGCTYRRLFESEAEIQALTVKALSGVVFRLMAELEDVHACTVEQRLAKFLLGRASGAGVVAMTQQEIANNLGTTREVVARALGELARQRIVASARGRVTIVAPQRLVAVSAPWRTAAG